MCVGLNDWARLIQELLISNSNETDSNTDTHRCQSGGQEHMGLDCTRDSEGPRQCSWVTVLHCSHKGGSESRKQQKKSGI